MNDMPPHSNLTTSRDAAMSVRHRTAAQRERVRRFIGHFGGATDEEIAYHLGLDLNSVRPRRWELVNAGVVADTLTRRPTMSGRRAIVWGVLRSAAQA